MEISLKDKAQSRSARLLSGVALVALLTGWSIPAQAAADPETLAEIRALKAKLHQLEHRMDAQAQTQRRESAKAGAAAPAGGSGVVVQSSDGRSWPDKFTYKGITITPGGFIALEVFGAAGGSEPTLIRISRISLMDFSGRRTPTNFVSALARAACRCWCKAISIP